MLISMVVVQLGASARLIQRDQPWRIATVLATTYLVFRVFRSLQIDLTRARRDLAEARGRAEADARRIREAHRIALMAEDMAGVGHWRVDLASGETTWSEGVFRIYGREHLGRGARPGDPAEPFRRRRPSSLADRPEDGGRDGRTPSSSRRA